MDQIVLDVENVLKLPVVTLGPNMVPGRTIDQLGRNSDPTARFAHTAFDDIGRAQLCSGGRRIDRSALEGEAGAPGDHWKRAPMGQRGDQILGQTIREILLLRVARDVLERKHGDGRTVAPMLLSRHG
ncbi:MAG: hypothetical protein AAGE80_13670 [Pseudomonadota bacterium]